MSERGRPIGKPTYVAMIRFGTATVCSEHKTLAAAKKAAAACEKRGGSKHFFWRVTRCK